jgi:hypothetical protein
VTTAKSTTKNKSSHTKRLTKHGKKNKTKKHTRRP